MRSLAGLVRGCSLYSLIRIGLCLLFFLPCFQFLGKEIGDEAELRSVSCYLIWQRQAWDNEAVESRGGTSAPVPKPLDAVL